MASINVSCVPRNPELLWLQAADEHRSYNISHDRALTEEPRCRRGDEGLNRKLQDGVPDEVAYTCQLDHSLIIALAERWRPETNTFYLPIGEVTVTLQDVQVIWGLPIQGPPVCGKWVTETRNVEYWKNLCQEYLGIYPEDDDLRKGRMKFNRLAGTITFEHWDPNDEERCKQVARRVILALIGSQLFPDSNSYDVSLNYWSFLGDLSIAGRRSWGSATLCCFIGRGKDSHALPHESRHSNWMTEKKKRCMNTEVV
uniref:serine/threonine-protein phosphatase 7 long form homolog n=1 Tax=Erigeron canadensis TaxID=72917 RepID=UPI001CB8A5ED|nr:serine/threonine-protein phosphatase 7 long form homolog [Erigeron canadensis]